METNSPTSQPNYPPTDPQAVNTSSHKWLIPFLTVGLIISLLVNFFLYYKFIFVNNGLNTSNDPNSEKIEKIEEITDTKDIYSAEWQTYTYEYNTYKHQAYFEYPDDWKLSLDPQVGHYKITVTSPNHEIIQIERFDLTTDHRADTSYQKNIYLPENGSFLITFIDCNEKDCHQSENSLNIFNKLVEGFKYKEMPKTQDQNEIESFINEYISAINNQNWQLVKSMLTESAQKQFDQNMMKIQIDKYNILSLDKSINESYIAMISMGSNGKVLQNPMGNPELTIRKENGSWKTDTWYLFP